MTQQQQAAAEPEKKTAQSFLGSAAGLVNLDNLVQKPKQPAATNPFGMSSAMTPQGTQSRLLLLQLSPHLYIIDFRRNFKCS